MNEKKLNKSVVEIEKSIENEQLEDGLTILSATLAHTLILAINNGHFDRSKLHVFFEEIESRVMTSTKQLPY